MGDLQAAHCRFCAELKSYSKLVDLETDELKKCITFEKLSRLGIVVSNLESADDILPKTVCFVCMELLDRCFGFVSAVEVAQIELNGYVSQKIKEEISCVSYDEDKSCDEPVEAEDAFKTESQPAKEVPEVSTEIQKNENLDSYLDTPPQSQHKLSWKDYSWKCAFCDTLFPNIDELKEHSIKYHGCCNSYRCIDCNIRKLKLDSFVIHIKNHRKYLKLSCYKCHKEFSSSHDTHKHQSTDIDSDFCCSGCNETFSSQEKLSQHIVTYSKDRRIGSLPEELTDNLTCLQCQKTCTTKGGLKTHLMTHTERKRDYTCEKCGKCFLNRSNLDGHMMMHNDTKPHQCKICERHFRRMSHLRDHIRVHNTAKPYSCEQCGRQFRLEKLLKTHVVIHSDLLPFECTVCHKAFRFRQLLEQHMRQHTGVKPYRCEICVRDFTNWPNYNKHMKTQHNKNMAKKKFTPNGPFPINPATGEVMEKPQTQKALEWMKEVMEGPRKPKVKGKNSSVKMFNADEDKS